MAYGTVGTVRDMDLFPTVAIKKTSRESSSPRWRFNGPVTRVVLPSVCVPARSRRSQPGGRISKVQGLFSCSVPLHVLRERLGDTLIRDVRDSGDMWRSDHVFRKDRVCHVHGFIPEDVEPGAGDLPGPECGKQGIRIEEPAPGHVDDEHPFLHCGNLRCTDEVEPVRGVVDAECHIIGFRKCPGELFKGIRAGDLHPGHGPAGMVVHSYDPDPEAGEAAGQFPSYPAEA